MTKTHALLKLLEHGPLTRQEMREITLWTDRQIHSTLQYLSREDRIRPVGKKGMNNQTPWALTNGSCSTI